MSIAIIAEYNPFHNGHIYQLKEAKKRFPNEKIIVILAQKYVQRGEIAVASFYQRKKMALTYGANKVVKMPFAISTQAAHIFAQGAVFLAHKHKATKLFFGSESNDVSKLEKLANLIIKKQKEYDQLVKTFLKEGLSFPKATANALSVLSNTAITQPNDILGFEYCKVIAKYHLPIKPYSLKRTIDFHGSEAEGKYASASFLRTLIYQNKDIKKYSPMKIKHFKRIENYYPRFQKIVKKYPAAKLKNIKLMSEGMENLFKKHINAPDYDSFVDLCTSRRYTAARIKRVMLYVLLKKWG